MHTKFYVLPCKRLSVIIVLCLLPWIKPPLPPFTRDDDAEESDSIEATLSLAAGMWSYVLSCHYNVTSVARNQAPSPSLHKGQWCWRIRFYRGHNFTCSRDGELYILSCNIMPCLSPLSNPCYLLSLIRFYRLVGWMYWEFTSLQWYFSHIATWKQEITNLWKFKWWCRESNPVPLAPQAKSLTTRPPLLTDSIEVTLLLVAGMQSYVPNLLQNIEFIIKHNLCIGNGSYDTLYVCLLCPFI